jgi:hypothetical protein
VVFGCVLTQGVLMQAGCADCFKPLLLRCRQQFGSCGTHVCSSFSHSHRHGTIGAPSTCQCECAADAWARNTHSLLCAHDARSGALT